MFEKLTSKEREILSDKLERSLLAEYDPDFDIEIVGLLDDLRAYNKISPLPWGKY